MGSNIDEAKKLRTEARNQLKNLIKITREQMKEAWSAQKYVENYDLENKIYVPATRILIDLDRANFEQLIEDEMQSVTTELQRINTEISKNIDEIKDLTSAIDKGAQTISLFESIIKTLIQFGILL